MTNNQFFSIIAHRFDSSEDQITDQTSFFSYGKWYPGTFDPGGHASVSKKVNTPLISIIANLVHSLLIIKVDGLHLRVNLPRI